MLCRLSTNLWASLWRSSVNKMPVLCLGEAVQVRVTKNWSVFFGKDKYLRAVQILFLGDTCEPLTWFFMATSLFRTASSEAKILVNKLHRKPPLIFLCACVFTLASCIFRGFYIWKLSVSTIKHHSRPHSGIHSLPGTIFFMTLFPPRLLST